MSGISEKSDEYVYLLSKKVTNIYVQVCRLFSKDVDLKTIESSVKFIRDQKDTYDFHLLALIHFYFCADDKVFDGEYTDIKILIKKTLLEAKYWYDEPHKKQSKAIFFTENHQLMFWTCGYLACLLFPEDIFASGLMGLDYKEKFETNILNWLKLRKLYGCVEWNSEFYMSITLNALINLIEHGQNDQIIKLSTELSDEICENINKYTFLDSYASAQSREYDDTLIGTKGNIMHELTYFTSDRDSNIKINLDTRFSGLLASTIATSTKWKPIKYKPLESLHEWIVPFSSPFPAFYAEGQALYLYYTGNTNYLSDEKTLHHWARSDYLTKEVIEETLDAIKTYKLDTNTMFGPSIILSAVKFFAKLRSLPLDQFIYMNRAYSIGLTLDPVTLYNYKTKNFALSGINGYSHAGYHGSQELPWIAKLPNDISVFTSYPTWLSKDFNNSWVGGWIPYAEFNDNVGIIQYDSSNPKLTSEIKAVSSIANFFTKKGKYQNLHFPKSKMTESKILAEAPYFDNKVLANGTWLIGHYENSYIAVFSMKAGKWKNETEYRVKSNSNVWIVVVSDTARDFYRWEREILSSIIEIKKLSQIGYIVSYNSFVSSWNLE